MRPVGTTSTWRHRLKAFCTCAASSRRNHNVSQQHGESRECPEFLRHPPTPPHHAGSMSHPKARQLLQEGNSDGRVRSGVQSAPCCWIPKHQQAQRCTVKLPCVCRNMGTWVPTHYSSPCWGDALATLIAWRFHKQSALYENTPLSHYIKHNKNTPVWA